MAKMYVISSVDEVSCPPSPGLIAQCVYPNPWPAFDSRETCSDLETALACSSVTAVVNASMVGLTSKMKVQGLRSSAHVRDSRSKPLGEPRASQLPNFACV